MFKGFQLKGIDYSGIQKYKQYAEELYDEYDEHIQASLDSYLSVDGEINATKLQSDWFPEIAADVFISHSHADVDDALCLAGWLYKKLGIKSFIDSQIWGYANTLLKQIDETCCIVNGKMNYHLRNESTGHVHAMLHAALAKMIDKTECLFFMYTGRSVSTEDSILGTNSPWIYSEIETSRIVRLHLEREQNTIIFPIQESFSSSVRYFNHVVAKYDLDLEHLQQLSAYKLNKWVKYRRGRNAEYNLDVLYQLYGG